MCGNIERSDVLMMRSVRTDGLHPRFIWKTAPMIKLCCRH